MVATVATAMIIAINMTFTFRSRKSWVNEITLAVTFMQITPLHFFLFFHAARLPQ